MADKQFDSLLQQLQGWIGKATAPSPYETQSNQDYTNIQNFLGGHDYRNPNQSGVSIDLLPKSDYTQQMNTLRGAPSTDPITSRQQQFSDNQFDQNYGNAYENQIANLMPRQLGLTSSLENLYTGRMNAGLTGYSDALQGLRNKPQGFNWMGLISGGLNAASGLSNLFGSSGAPQTTPLGGGYSVPGNGMTGLHEGGQFV